MKLGKKMTVKAVNEKKLSIYQKALEELPQCEELIIGNLRVCLRNFVFFDLSSECIIGNLRVCL
jgi:hypothetical protein